MNEDSRREPASTADAGVGEVAPGELHYGVIKMGRRQFPTRFHPSRDDIQFWESGEWKPYSIAEFQRRQAEAGILGQVRDGPVDAAPAGLLGRLGRRIERRRLRHRLGEVVSELFDWVRTESHNVEVCTNLGKPGDVPAARAAGKADGFTIAGELIAGLIEELR